nr:hypothetical protein JVH1_1606 [Rhodococcus sp. JVH1]
MAIHVRESKQSSLNLCYFVDSTLPDSASCQRAGTSADPVTGMGQHARSAAGAARSTR